MLFPELMSFGKEKDRLDQEMKRDENQRHIAKQIQEVFKIEVFE